MAVYRFCQVCLIRACGPDCDHTCLKARHFRRARRYTALCGRCLRGLRPHSGKEVSYEWDLNENGEAVVYQADDGRFGSPEEAWDAAKASVQGPMGGPRGYVGERPMYPLP